MSDRKSLAERRAVQEQRKAKLAEEEAKLRVADRKLRTQMLIKFAGNFANSELLHLPPNTINGMRIDLEERLKNDPAQEAAWKALGGQRLAEEAQQREEAGEKLLIIFPAPLPKGAAAPLKKARFKFSKVFQHWEGIGSYAEAAHLAAAHGGRVQRVNPSEPSSLSVSESIIPPVRSPAEETQTALDKAVSEPLAMPVADPQPESEKAGSSKKRATPSSHPNSNASTGPASQASLFGSDRI